jgi:threonylcarbamoyladenosine tRNA methylthiotransferase MtaB
VLVTAQQFASIVPVDIQTLVAEKGGTGYTPGFARVAVPAGTLPGKIVSVAPRRVERGLLQ